MNTVETLKAAKAHISDPKMWYKGSLCKGYDVQKETPCCIVGALGFATNGSADIIEGLAFRIARKALDDAAGFDPRNGDSLPDFNDHPDTTHADIMALFDRAIEVAEKEGAA